MLQYHDTYRRVDGAWVFERRKFHRWYQIDALERPFPGAGMGPQDDPISTSQLPEAFPSWVTGSRRRCSPRIQPLSEVKTMTVLR